MTIDLRALPITHYDQIGRRKPGGPTIAELILEVMSAAETPMAAPDLAVVIGHRREGIYSALRCLRRQGKIRIVGMRPRYGAYLWELAE